jgi:hypothetical protein
MLRKRLSTPFQPLALVRQDACLRADKAAAPRRRLNFNQYDVSLS